MIEPDVSARLMPVRDGSPRHESRIAAVIRETKPDIIGLQEVNFNRFGESKTHQLDYLAEATK
jgi:endonuclease/exonuclease/phosphatase family metal-dependent hydrolase